MNGRRLAAWVAAAACIGTAAVAAPRPQAEAAPRVSPGAANPAGAAAVAGPIGLEVWGGLGTMDGDTTYQIGFPVTLPNGIVEEGFFPFSELKFPLNVTMAEVGARLPLGSLFEVRALWRMNVADEPDDMEDYDWLLGPGSLDIYSESQSQLEATIAQGSVRFIPLRSAALQAGIGLGFLYQDYGFECSLIRQSSPSGVPGFDAVGDGSVGLTYDVTYQMPFVEVFAAGRFLQDRLALAGSLAIGAATAEDEDHHMLRNPPKTSKGDTDGEGLMVSLEARFHVTPVVFVGARCDWLSIETDGDQKQVFETGGAPDPIGTVKQEIETTQTHATAFLGVSL